MSTAFLGPGECVLPRCELDKVQERPLLVHAEKLGGILLCLSSLRHTGPWQASVPPEAYDNIRSPFMFAVSWLLEACFQQP